MITKLSIADPKKLPISWWSKIKTLSTIQEFNFSPGLNILWGRNGSGKSTLLKLIAKMFHAEQARFSFITYNSISELFPNKFSGVKITHDGQGIAYLDPSHKIGLIGGLAGFDYDFMDGVGASLSPSSSGQWTLHTLTEIFGKLNKNKTIKPQYKINENNINDLYKKRLALVKEFFMPSIELGNATIVMDEPDKSLDIPRQEEMWDTIPFVGSKIQLIIATHSPFAANIKGANYIEMNSGYLEKCVNAITKISPNANVIRSSLLLSNKEEQVPIVKHE